MVRRPLAALTQPANRQVDRPGAIACLLVVGGHPFDDDGISYAGLYDPNTNTWMATAPMTRPAGEECVAGSDSDDVDEWDDVGCVGQLRRSRAASRETAIVVDLLHVWDNGTWKTIKKADGAPLNFIGLPFYQRFHVASDGRVFISGTADRTLLLKTTQPGQWTEVGFRSLGNRDYCPAAMYDVDKIITLDRIDEVSAPPAQCDGTAGRHRAGDRRHTEAVAQTTGSTARSLRGRLIALSQSGLVAIGALGTRQSRRLSRT